MRNNFWTKAILGFSLLYGMLMAYNTMVADPNVPPWFKLVPVFIGCVLILWWFRKWLVPLIAQIVGGFFRGLGQLLYFLFYGLRRWQGAHYMPVWEGLFFFLWSNSGWLVDGKRKRLSAKVSFQSVSTIAPMGAGKTSFFCLPNLYTLDKCSLVISDIKGTTYEKTSGYLKRKGFDIQVFDLIDMHRSHGFNPLHNLNSFNDISKIAHLLIAAGNHGGKESDPFWNNSAEKFIRIIIQCLKNRGDADICTLPRVKELLSQFDHFNAEPGQSVFDRWVLESTLNDQTTWQDYKTFIGGPEKTIKSVLTTADTALMSLGNRDLADLLSQHDFDFAQLRKKKTALYIRVLPQDMGNLAFVLSAFYVQLFNQLLQEINSSHLPVYAILDEFGNMKIPNFATIASTAREYKLAFWIFLQSEAQLFSHYSQHEARTIMEALGTQIYLAGTGLETTEKLSRIMGQARSRPGQKNKAMPDRNLMNPDEIRTMSRNEAILIHGNRHPIRYWAKPYFKHRRFKRYADIPAAELPYLKQPHANSWNSGFSPEDLPPKSDPGEPPQPETPSKPEPVPEFPQPPPSANDNHNREG